MNNLEDVAKNLLQYEKSMRRYSHPEPISVLVTWKNNTYIGHIQEIVPEFSKEIVALSKSTRPLSNELTQEIRKIDKERLELYTDNNIDLEGRQHILRRIDNRLTHMNTKQTEYMVKNPPMIREITLREITL